MSKERRNHSPAFKARVALEAVKGQEQKARNAAALTARPYQENGQLKVERDFLAERSGP